MRRFLPTERRIAIFTGILRAEFEGKFIVPGTRATGAGRQGESRFVFRGPLAWLDEGVAEPIVQPHALEDRFHQISAQRLTIFGAHIAE